MNKLKALALAMLPMMWACTSNDVDAPQAPTFPEGLKEAYLCVNIQDVNALYGTRADDDEFENGSLAEHDVKSGIFFFYDDKGKYLTTGHIKRVDWNDPTPGTDPAEPDADKKNDNVEYIGENIITMPLKTNVKPTYMITVLNHEESLAQRVMEGELTMDQTSQLVASTQPKSGSPFIMSTTSFFDKTKTDYEPTSEDKMPKGAIYYTKIPSENIHTTLTDAQADKSPMSIYVERLAAKVTLKFQDGVDGNGLFKINGAFKVNVTPTTDDKGNITGYEVKDDKADGTNRTQLYAQILGWGLSGTARTSNLSKKISASYTDYLQWNETGRNRSYWGEGVWYGLPTNDQYTYLGETTGQPETPYPIGNHKLQFINWDQLEGTIGNPLYCFEHTNTTANTHADKSDGKGSRVVPKNVTCVLVKAKLGTKGADGKLVPLDVIKYNGDLVDQDYFIPYLLHELNAHAMLNYYTMVTKTEGDKTIEPYKQLGVGDFKLQLVQDDKGKGTGKVEVVYKGETLPDLYYKAVNNDGTPVLDENKQQVYYQYNGTHKEINATGEEISVKNRALTIASFNTEINSYGNAMAYTGGTMYYVIPIEHLNTPTVKDEDNNDVKDLTKEGSYGVVRNHHYQVTINSIAKIGYGTFHPGDDEIEKNPGEPIIPEDPDPETHIKADIKVLSWKLVNQSVDL